MEKIRAELEAIQKRITEFKEEIRNEDNRYHLQSSRDNLDNALGFIEDAVVDIDCVE